MQKRPTKYIFVTGGVVSGLGKGIAAASIGAVIAHIVVRERLVVVPDQESLLVREVLGELRLVRPAVVVRAGLQVLVVRDVAAVPGDVVVREVELGRRIVPLPIEHGWRRIVERGTHAQLLARGGLYARLYREQFEDAAKVVRAHARQTPLHRSRIFWVDWGNNGQDVYNATRDDGTLPSITINDVAVTEGNSGTVSASFPLTLSATSAHAAEARRRTGRTRQTGCAPQTTALAMSPPVLIPPSAMTWT